MRFERRRPRKGTLILLVVATLTAAVVFAALGGHEGGHSTTASRANLKDSPNKPYATTSVPNAIKPAADHTGARRVSVTAPYLIQVRDESNVPVAGAEVLEENVVFGTTDASGACLLSVAGSGSLEIRVVHPEYFTAHVTVDLSEEKSVVRLERRHSLRVKVIDAHGQALVGVRIGLEGVPAGLLNGPKELETGPDSGVAVFTSLPAGNYFLSVADEGWIPSKFQATARDPSGAGIGRPGVYRVPETVEVTVTASAPSVACVKVQGDEVVRHWWRVRFAKSFMAPGVSESLRKVRKSVMEQHEGALVYAWLPSEPVQEVRLSVFLRHGGWRELFVPVTNSIKDIVPYVLSVDASGPDRTGIIELRADEGVEVPIVAVQADSGYGTIRADLAAGERVRVPLGRYSIELSPTARGLRPYVDLDPEVVDLLSAGSEAAVRARSSQPIRKRDFLVFVQPDATGEPRLVRGAVQVYHDERLLYSTVFSGQNEPRALRVPVGVPLTWNMKMQKEGRVMEFAATITADEGSSSVTEVVLR